MNILVTGGAGYVGSHAARWLARAGHEVWVYDNLSQGHRAASLPGRLIVGDLADHGLLATLLAERRIEAVLHFAARTLVGESVDDPGPYYETNVAASITLLEAMRASGVRRIVFSSSTAVYGAPNRDLLRETDPKRPINPYGFAKLTVERILADYARAYGFACAAMRYFNAAGASPHGDLGEDHAPETHLIPLCLQAALGQREKVAIFGADFPTPDGTCLRDYVHVDDLAEAHRLALERLAAGRRLAFNLGTGRAASVREVVETCRRVTGRPIVAVPGPRRAGDAPRLVADARRARRLLGWRPRYPDLESIIASAWRWHAAHPHGFAGRAQAARTVPIATAAAA